MVTIHIYWEHVLSNFEPDFSKIEYDYIVVGGGSAGCVLARRLSDDRHAKVALLEAGGTPSILTSIPALASFLQLSPLDWAYSISPQDNACMAMNNRQCLWPRGKVLGGTSHLNYMLYVRGDKEDYEDWAKITQDERWSFKEVLKYFKIAEAQHGNYKNDLNSHGTDGLFQVRDSVYSSDFVNIYQNMSDANGYKVGDINDSEGSIGGKFTIRPQVNLDKNGRRADTYRSYLADVTDRDNLFIIKHATVTKILFEEPSPGETQETKLKTSGIEFIRFGLKQRLFTKREIILAAGAIGSPKILLQSGIGPKDDLEEVGIQVIKDLAHVGANLKDHICTMIGPFFPIDDESGKIVENFKSFDILQDLTLTNMYNFLVYGNGPLAATGAVDAMSFFNSNDLPNTTIKENGFSAKSTHSSTQPNIQAHFMALTFGTDYGTSLYHTIGIPKDLWDQFVSPSYGYPGMMVLPVLLHPKSSGGSVKLSSSDPSMPPFINPKYYSNVDDVNTLIKGIKHVINMLEKVSTEHNSKEMRIKLMRHLFPGCSMEAFKTFDNVDHEEFVQQHFASDKYWECYIRHLTLTMYHPVGTCKMGVHEDDSVVDSKLRVHGINGLRVADASIMPDITSGNTNAPTVMIAELASDLIKQEWASNTNKIETSKSNHNDAFERKQTEEEMHRPKIEL